MSVPTVMNHRFRGSMQTWRWFVGSLRVFWRSIGIDLLYWGVYGNIFWLQNVSGHYRIHPQRRHRMLQYLYWEDRFGVHLLLLTHLGAPVISAASSYRTAVTNQKPLSLSKLWKHIWRLSRLCFILVGGVLFFSLFLFLFFFFAKFSYRRYM